MFFAAITERNRTGAVKKNWMPPPSAPSVIDKVRQDQQGVGGADGKCHIGGAAEQEPADFPEVEGVSRKMKKDHKTGMIRVNIMGPLRER